MGKGIPPNPAHIASGCAALEVLVARGTSEPNYEAKVNNRRDQSFMDQPTDTYSREASSELLLEILSSPT
jgi:hypothetical protein